MAYKGNMDYLKLEFDHRDCAHLRSPWNTEYEKRIAHVDSSALNIALVTYAQICDLKTATETEIERHLDNQGRLFQRKSLCVVFD